MTGAILNIPAERTAEFEAECRRLDTPSEDGRVYARFVRLGESGGYVGYRFTGPDWLAKQWLATQGG